MYTPKDFKAIREAILKEEAFELKIGPHVVSARPNRRAPGTYLLSVGDEDAKVAHTINATNACRSEEQLRTYVARHLGLRGL